MTARAAKPRGRAADSTAQLTVAVTGATGTLGPALLARLAADRRVERIVVLGRRRPATLPAGAATELHTVDVRDGTAVERAVDGVDVVVHAAYALYGVASREADLFATNVEGTLNVARAAAAAGATRFVYTSSSAVYGFHADNPWPVDEDCPIRASGHHFYGRHKAQTELLVRDALADGRTSAYVVRPCAIVGPHAAGGALSPVPGAAVRLARAGIVAAARAGLRPLAPAPPVPLQFVHEDDVAQALVRAAVGQGSPGTYNLAGEGVVDGSDVLRLLGVRELHMPRAAVHAAFRAAAAVPPLLPALGWSELGTQPLILSTEKARSKLGWRPRYASGEALADTRRALGW
jgi:nucleoside-diphosphate-sugar epimerase